MSQRRISLILILIATAGLIAACGAGKAGSGLRRTGAQQEAAAVTVIRDWANALRRGDVGAAAGYFALPSIFANGVGTGGQVAEVVIHTRSQARMVNESLSCGARLISTRRHGKYIDATFGLTNRSGPGAGCGSGTGLNANVDFVIARGRIVDWIRGANTSGGGTPKAPTAPANSEGPTQQI